MNPSIVRVLDPDRCESVLAEINGFVGAEYTETNIRDRRGQVYEYGLDLRPSPSRSTAPGAPRATTCRASASTRSQRRSPR